MVALAFPRSIYSGFSRPVGPAAVLHRLNVRVLGTGTTTLLFCNGLNCSQRSWEPLVLALAAHYQLVLFDQMGTGGAELSAYEPAKYATLNGYAQDVVELCQALDLRNVVVVGHSAGAMIALLATIQAPTYFAKAVLLAASPYYLNEPGYHGGFEREAMLAHLDAMRRDYQSQTAAFATQLVGKGNPTTLGPQLMKLFCEAEPLIAKRFARLVYLGDHRADLPKVLVPTLLLQGTEDVVVPSEVGRYLQRQLPNATLVTLRTSGHCPHLSAPQEVLGAMQQFLAAPVSRARPTLARPAAAVAP